MEKKAINLKSYFNDKQLEVLKYNNRVRPTFIICDGAIRSGKTFFTVSAFLVHVESYRNKGYEFIVLGHSIGAIERNVLRVMREWFGIDTTLDKYNSFALFGNRVYCFGGADKDSKNAIQGMTAAGCYGNELTLVHEDAIKESIGRCSIDGSRFFFEMNPGNPAQFIYKEFILPTERAGNGTEYARFNWKIDDNSKTNGGFLKKDYIDRLKRTYKGLWFRKYINGEWVQFEGSIYTIETLQFYDDTIIDEDKKFFENAKINGFLDPAGGSKKKTGCFTTIITGAEKTVNNEKRIYILDVHLKKSGVAETIKATGERLDRFRYSSFKYENNFAQDLFIGKPLKKAFPFSPISGQAAREDKLSRLIGMSNVVMTKVYFPKRFLHEVNTDGNLLIQQLCNIDRDRKEDAEADEMMLDGPDGLEGLIRSFASGSGKTAATGGNKLNGADSW